MKRTIIIYASCQWSSITLLNSIYYAIKTSARGYRVIFIESIGLRSPEIKKSSSDRRRVISRLFRMIFTPIRKRRGVIVFTPFFGPSFMRKLFLYISRFQIILLRGSSSAVHWVFLPSFYDMLRIRKNDIMFYHPVDDYSFNPGADPRSIAMLEKQCISSAEKIAVTTEKLGEKFSLITTKPIEVFDNRVFDCDLKIRNITCVNEDIHSPSYVHVGNIAAYKLDFVLIRKIALNNPGCHFYFLGPRSLGEIDDVILDDIPANVYFLPAVPHKDILGVLSRFDHGFLPFRKNKRIAYAFPMKYMEFLAAGLDVFSTDVSTMKEQRFVSIIDENSRLPQTGASQEQKQERKEYVKEFCWHKRVEAILEYFEADR